MIGVLCNHRDEKKTTKTLYSLLKTMDPAKNIPVVVFSLSKINMQDRTVYGSIVSEKSIRHTRISLPSLIFNFSVQFKKSGIKNLRNLMEVEDVTIINAVNHYNQWSIMKMLAANPLTKDHLFPGIRFLRDELCSSLPEDDHFLILPKNTSAFSKVTYIRQSDEYFDIYSGRRNYCCCWVDFPNSLKSILHGKKWILLRTPELIIHKNQLYTVRVYLQKSFHGEWTVLSKMTYPKENDSLHTLEETYSAALQMVENVNCYIPDLGLCYIDFVFDNEGTPYFLNFGGYDTSLLHKTFNKSIQMKLCRNMLQYAQIYASHSKGEGNHVG